MEQSRKVLYYIGNAISIIGIVLFLSVFVTGFNGDFDTIESSMKMAPIGMILLIVGVVISNIGKSGLAGSGVILDPEKAREDLKPFSKQAGGMIKDALEEVNLPNNETIKVRCQSCKHLNDENAKYCNNCGNEL